jgi:hypothetical protein
MEPCNLHRIITCANKLHNGILTVLIKLKIIAGNFKLQHLMYNIIVEQVINKPGHGPHLCKVVKRKKKLDSSRTVEFWSHCVRLALNWKLRDDIFSVERR